MLNNYNDSEMLINSIGDKIRKLRLQRELTIQQVAEMTGLSSSLISQVERGLAHPSITTLWKISRFFEVHITYFFDDQPKSPIVIVRADEQKQLTIQPSLAVYRLLSPDMQRAIEFLRIDLEPGLIDQEDLVTHEGEECGYIIQGQLGIRTQDRTYLLNEGDSVYLDSQIPHRFFNPGEVTCISIWAITPPSF